MSTILIETLEDLVTLIDYIENKDFIAFDIETTGLSLHSSEIIGVAVCAEVDKAFYVILKNWNTNTKRLDSLVTNELIEKLLISLKSKKLIMHNGVFDCSMIEARYNIRLIESLFHDTMLSGHLLNENLKVGLKDRGVATFGEDVRQEQKEMKNSVLLNGGKLTKKEYELYKADSKLIGHYGAKDALLTLNLFYNDVPLLFEEKLDKFFYEDEVMPLSKGPTYELNTVGLKIDLNKLLSLKSQLQAECAELKCFIEKELQTYIKDKYPGTGKTNKFNIGSSKQLSWLLYERLGNVFLTLTNEGRDLCNFLNLKLPYTFSAKKQFIELIRSKKNELWGIDGWNPKTKRKTKVKKISDPWNYISCNKESIEEVKEKYKWAQALLTYTKTTKLLKTYVEGILTRETYGIIHPSFKQTGTTSGRYSSSNPNFQNLPRKDKRIKECIISRPNNVLVGADYSQLEPRVFASLSKDERLLNCFKTGEDFYSVIGAEIFDKEGSLKKDEDNSFAKKYPELRTISKTIALSATYGTTASKMAPLLKVSSDTAQEIIDNYFYKFPSVKTLMQETHGYVKEKGYVLNLFGRPRRIPEALDITRKYGKTPHDELPYTHRTLLNLAVNHRIQSTAASIMNRAAIKCYNTCRQKEKDDILWKDVHIVMQVHDELILEGPKQLSNDMAQVLKDAMENTTVLPEVALIAEPKIGNSLSDLKEE